MCVTAIDGPVVIDAVVCVGNEQRLSDCFLSKNDDTSFCTHDNDVGVQCSKCASCPSKNSSCQSNKLVPTKFSGLTVAIRSYVYVSHTTRGQLTG